MATDWVPLNQEMVQPGKRIPGFEHCRPGGLRLRVDCDGGSEALVELVDCKRRPARSTPRGVNGFLKSDVFVSVPYSVL